MHQAEPAPTTPLQRRLLWLVYGLSALLGMVYGYGFGKVLGGPIVGVVLALNGAVFCSIVAGALAETLCRWWQAPRQPRRPSAI